MTIRERIGPMVRVNLALANCHSRQAGAALWIQPLAAPLDIRVGPQQLFNVVTAIELVNHRG
ncbi:hypothetical protein D3C87_2157440 [compost metagenome]